MRRRILLTACLLTSVLSFAMESVASEWLTGAASVSITPPQPVALSGQRRTRVAREVESPVTATALR